METPLTTFAGSLIKSVRSPFQEHNGNIPDFDDQFVYASISNNNSSLLDGFRNKYNIILIVLETTIIDYYSPSEKNLCYLPSIKSLIPESIYCSNYFSPAPKSTKAFFAILTGMYPLTSYQYISRIHPDINVPTIFSILKENGYSSFAGYSGDFNYDNMLEFLKNRGVDRFCDINDDKGKYKKTSWCTDDELIYDNLLEWIKTSRNNNPFFALLITMNGHHPFWTPKEDLKIMAGTDINSRYINSAHYQDHLIGKLVNNLLGNDLLKNTIIIITGDHGSVFGFLKDRGEKIMPDTIDKMSFHVPFYIYLPFLDKKGVQDQEQIFDSISNHTDILPTILDITGIERNKNIQGRSIFDPKIESRVSFVFSDRLHHLTIGLTQDWYLLNNSTTKTIILSKSLDFSKDYSPENSLIFDRLLNHVEIFDKYQNNRLLKFVN